MTLRILLVCSFIALLTAGRAWGHSHVWIHGAVIVQFDQKGLAGFRQEWVFDEMFSHMIIHDFDKNRNGALESEEVQAVYKGAFSNLHKFGYFTRVKVNGKPFSVSSVRDFNAKIVGNRVVYHFYVPCPVEAGSSSQEVRIGVYDESFYTSITILKDQIFFENTSGYAFDYKVALNEEEPYYFGQVYPEEIILKFRTKE